MKGIGGFLPPGVFVSRRAEHPDRGVPPVRVVPGFDPLEGRRPELFGVSQFVRVSSSSLCMVDQNDSIIELSTEEAARLMDPSRRLSRSR